MEFLFKNAGDVKLIFHDDLEKENGSDWDCSNIDFVFNTGERSETENIDYKKVKQPLDPLSYPSNLHTGANL